MRHHYSETPEARISRRLKAIDKTNRQDVCNLVDREKNIFDRSLKLQKTTLIEDNNRRNEKKTATTTRNRNTATKELEKLQTNGGRKTLTEINELIDNNNQSEAVDETHPLLVKNTPTLPPIKIPAIIIEESEEHLLNAVAEAISDKNNNNNKKQPDPLPPLPSIIQAKKTPKKSIVVNKTIYSSIDYITKRNIKNTTTSFFPSQKLPPIKEKP